ncbi:MAG TPA: hypothetical protein VJU87_10815 [Gemmatimonadaceae bacterium]|nr:hypothetical protein [Gemmatimonadaceae bacterium]
MMVDGAAIVDEMLADLRELEEDDVVSLQQASAIGGYSIDHLQRLVREGRIENRGRKHAPRIRRADVPVKAGFTGALPMRTGDAEFSIRRRIVADVKHGDV